MKKILLLFIVVLTFQVNAQDNLFKTKDSIAQVKWVDSIMSSMSIDQKIGQLLMIPAYSNKDQKHINAIENAIKKYELGGLIFMQGTAKGHASLINKYQSKSKIPLLISIDGEWGLDMRIKKTVGFPYNMALGAIRDDKLIADFGKRLGQQVKRVGIHVNFAPVVDINTNPKNPIIGNRSFGEDKYDVTEKSLQFVKGMQSENVLACAKHFPGHGDTSQDSHKTLPTVNFSAKRIDSIELYPYYKLFEAGLGSIMAAHLSIPSLEPNKQLPTSLSYNVVTKIAKDRMQFKGLIFTDALNMKGATKYYDSGEIEALALSAGNDVLLFPVSVSKAISKIKKQVRKGKIPRERIEESCRKILEAKYRVGLHTKDKSIAFIKKENLEKDLNQLVYEVTHRDLIEAGLTLIRNEKDILPIKKLKRKQFASLAF
ncbi:MAG: beta-N-acetylglucosaminidase, partial [Flavobacteriaceae bacterium]|nr:beta-N-acetylglucosaminidase [Flavobacteriaceae bacterium]